MILAIVAVVVGLVVLVWSADRFVRGASEVASFFGMPPLLIGMVVVGFGTSFPEMTVSALAAAEGAPAIALGNAYGSNIGNIALILGLTALISPIAVQSRVLKIELPILCVITGLSVALLWDLQLGRTDALVLLVTFAGLMGWSIYTGIKRPDDPLAVEMEAELEAADDRSVKRAGFWLAVGLILLIASSRSLVWGATEIATALGVNDLIVGLTVVAIGTSLPELASSITAARRNEHDLALGNILGSNLFNTLAVVGIAGAIQPFEFAPEVISRDMAVMGVLTLSLFAFGFGFGRPGRVNRFEGAVLLVAYIAYTVYLISTAV